MQTEGLVVSGGIFFSSLVAFGLYGLDFYLALLFVFFSWVLGESSRFFCWGFHVFILWRVVWCIPCCSCDGTVRINLIKKISGPYKMLSLPIKLIGVNF